MNEEQNDSDQEQIANIEIIPDQKEESDGEKHSEEAKEGQTEEDKKARLGELRKKMLKDLPADCSRNWESGQSSYGDDGYYDDESEGEGEDGGGGEDGDSDGSFDSVKLQVFRGNWGIAD